MPGKIDSPSSAHQVASLLARIDRFPAQIAAKDERLDEPLAQGKALNARIAELEAKLGGPRRRTIPRCRLRAGRRRTPSRRRSSHGAGAGPASRASWPRSPTRRFYAERCACGAVLGEAGQELAKEYYHIDVGPIRSITMRIGLFRAVCPCCKVWVTASAPADMPEGTPFGPGIASMIAYLHGCQMIGFKPLTRSGPLRPHDLAGCHRQRARRRRRGNRSAGRADRRSGAETSASVKGKTWWQWTFGFATAVYFVIAETRGKCVPTAFLAGAKLKMWLSDRLHAELRHAEAHQFCSRT